jgi:DNA-binding MarR family transcriptional regulator
MSVASSALIFKLVQDLTAAIGRDSPLTLALVFARVAIAGPEGVLQATVERELKLPSAVLTRAVQTLSGLHYGKNKPGLDLITRTIDNADGRHRVLRLTERGCAIVQSLKAAPSREHTLDTHQL